MKDLVPFQEGIYIPDNYNRAGLVYFVGGHSAVARSDWMALCLTDDEIVLCGRKGTLATVHLSAINRSPLVTTLEGFVIQISTSAGQQAVAPHLPYGVIVPYLKPTSGIEDQLVFYVGYRNVAQEWVNVINAALDVFHRKRIDTLSPRKK